MGIFYSNDDKYISLVYENEEISLNEANEIKVKDYKVVGYTRDEGDSIPHFHMVGLNDNKKLIAIRLDKAEYFVHGKHKDTLSRSEEKSLNEVLKKKYKKGRPETNWEYYANMYNKIHKHKKNAILVDIEKGQPDYSKLNQTR